MAGIYNASAKPNSNVPGKVNNAKLPSVETLLAAGIDPKTGLPIKAGGLDDGGFKPHNKKLIRIIDEQDALTRYKWYNLPNGLNQQLIERVLYYKGQGMFFYMDTDDKFRFLPYALDGAIDEYGRFKEVTPLPFNGSTDSGNKKKPNPWIKGLKRRVAYDIHLTELTADDILNSCVLLSDYCKQTSQTNISRQILNDPLIDVMADCIPYMRTALQNGTGIEGMRVQTEDDYSNVEAASRSINRAALTGKKFVPIIGSIEFQEMTGGEVAKAEEFLLAMQSLDNYRLSTYGIKNGGLFQKKAHMLEAEADVSGVSNSPLEDGLWQRQHFCDIVNSIWGLGIWCDTSETAVGADRDGDGTASENDPESVSYGSSKPDGGAQDESVQQ